MVDLRGLEPLTSSMPWMRSSSCATGPGNLRYALIVRDIGRTGKSYNPYVTIIPSSTPGFSDLLLTGEFSHQLQPCTTRLLSGEFWPTTPAHCMFLSLLYHNALRFAMHCSQ